MIVGASAMRRCAMMVSAIAWGFGTAVVGSPVSASDEVVGPICFTMSLREVLGRPVATPEPIEVTPTHRDYRLVFTLDGATGRTFAISGADEGNHLDHTPVTGSGFLASDGDTIQMLMLQPESEPGVGDARGLSALRIRFSRAKGEGVGECIPFGTGSLACVPGRTVVLTQRACLDGGAF